MFRLDLRPDRMHQLVAEFERLIRARLAHPAVAAPVATGTDGIVVYLVQAYVPADSLDVVIRDHGPIPPGDALRVASQLAGALDFAAAVDVHHGALHPRDVLLSQDEARLTGLGVTRALERVGVTPPVRRPYTAPERIEGGDWDRRADIFSLAALIHEMLWGRRVTGVGDEAARSLTELPGGDLAELMRVFARALAKDAADRFATALEFAAALKGAFPDVVMAPIVASHAPNAWEARALEEAVVTTDDRSTADPSDDFELRAAGQRDEEVPAPLAHMPLARVDAYRLTEVQKDTSRALVWPAAAAYLITGLAVGFGTGYLVFNRPPAVGVLQRSAPAAVTASAALPAAPESREYTEGAVKDAPVRPPPETPVRLPPSPRGGVGETRKPDTTEVEASARGRLLVRSTPANAQVFVDGRERGRTPATIRDLARGAHRVRVARDGYVAEEHRVVITANRPAQSLTVSLERPRASSAAVARSPVPRTPATVGTIVGTTVGTKVGTTTGTLDIVSRPPGARVFLDGTLVGTTPFSSAQVRAGAHAVRLEHDGYRRWSSSVRIVRGERNRVTASLER